MTIRAVDNLGHFGGGDAMSRPAATRSRHPGPLLHDDDRLPEVTLTLRTKWGTWRPYACTLTLDEWLAR